MTYLHVWQCRYCGYIYRYKSTNENVPMPYFPKGCKANPLEQKLGAPHYMVKVQ